MLLEPEAACRGSAGTALPTVLTKISFPRQGDQPQQTQHTTLLGCVCHCVRAPRKPKAQGVSKASGILTLPPQEGLQPRPAAGDAQKLHLPLTCKLTLSNDYKIKILEDRRGSLLPGSADGMNPWSTSQSRRGPSARHGCYFPVINSNRCAAVM